MKNHEEEFMDDEEIEIEDEIKDLIPSYLDNRRKDLVLLQEGLLKKEINTIKKIAHKIKGTALGYGQIKLDKIAQDLNMAIDNDDWKEIEDAVNEMQDVLGIKNVD
jgi:HPt (histidine-containing phosphotransfer) domain-containing protein